MQNSALIDATVYPAKPSLPTTGITSDLLHGDVAVTEQSVGLAIAANVAVIASTEPTPTSTISPTSASGTSWIATLWLSVSGVIKQFILIASTYEPVRTLRNAQEERIATAPKLLFIYFVFFYLYCIANRNHRIAGALR